jgi:hypothetical protein
MQKPFDPDKMTRHQRDWLECFGNQWAMSPNRVEPITADEKQALADALNPYRR